MGVVSSLSLPSRRYRQDNDFYFLAVQAKKEERERCNPRILKTLTELDLLGRLSRHGKKKKPQGKNAEKNGTSVLV